MRDDSPAVNLASWRPSVPWLPCRDCGRRFPCDVKAIPRVRGNRDKRRAQCPACQAAARRPRDAR